MRSHLRAWRPATIAALAALLAVCAPLLWRTSVPAGLELPDTDPRTLFSAAELREAERYERFYHALWAVATAAAIFALLVLMRWARRAAPGFGLGRIGTAAIVGAVTIAVLTAVELPFAAAAEWWQRRHGLAHGSWLEWLAEPWTTLLVESLFFIGFVCIVVALAARFRRDWWLAIVPVWIAISVALVAVLLALTPTYTDPLRDRELLADARSLAREVGAAGTPVDVEDKSDLTTQANAYAYKLGPIKRVVLWDTLLDGRFRDGEVRVILAHELAHVAREHVLKGIAWFVLISVPLWFLVAEVTRRRGGMHEPANIPFAVLVIGVLTLVFAPVENVLSRRYEAEADWVALQATEDPASARTLFQRFGRTSLSDPEPPGWAYVLFETHPTLVERIGMAEAWARRRGAASPAAP